MLNTLTNNLLEKARGFDDMEGHEFRKRTQKVIERLEYFQRTRPISIELSAIATEVATLERWRNRIMKTL